MKTQWYVVYCKGRSERKVADILIRKKIESYFPVNKLIHNRDADNRVIEHPLFDSYLFVFTTEKQISSIKRLPSVISLVYWLGKPVIISDGEINSLKRFLDEHSNVKLEKITIGKSLVKKINIPLIEEENSFTIVNQNIEIVLPSLGYKITAEETSNIRFISPVISVRKALVRSFKFNPAQIFNNF